MANRLRERNKDQDRDGQRDRQDCVFFSVFVCLRTALEMLFDNARPTSVRDRKRERKKR